MLDATFDTLTFFSFSSPRPSASVIASTWSLSQIGTSWGGRYGALFNIDQHLDPQAWVKVGQRLIEQKDLGMRTIGGPREHDKHYLAKKTFDAFRNSAPDRCPVLHAPGAVGASGGRGG